jgi:LysM repeat protein
MKTVLTYCVISGDTLSRIAATISACSGISAQQIAAANQSIDSNALHIGNILTIPANNGATSILHYTVLKGDTLDSIAAALAQCAGLSSQQIAHNNAEILVDNLQVGQRLNIPATASDVQDNATKSSPPAANIGAWVWTWSNGNVSPDTTISLAFSGWADVTTALEQSKQVSDRLSGEKYICIGGGNQDGAFTKSRVQAVTTAINNGELIAYQGIAYDIEQGDIGLEDDFAASFRAAKARGLKVLVSISHSAPYGIDDAAALMKQFFADDNIDFLSPQLYTTGSETANDYATSHGVVWTEYADCKAAVIPSIVTAELYNSAQQYFAQQGVTLQGFVQWSQTA